MKKITEETIIENYENGNIKIKKNYKNGKLEGLFERYNSEGYLQSSHCYKDNVENGPFFEQDTETHENIIHDISLTGSYLNGLMEGPFEKVTHGSHRIVEKGFYKKGKKEGTYSIKEVGSNNDVYWENEEFGTYVRGVKNGSYQLNKTVDGGSFGGSTTEYGNYRNGELDGLIKYDARDFVRETFYNNGRIMHEIEFKNGEKSGRWEFFYKNGQLKSSINYNRGEKNGEYLYYYKHGDLKFRINFRSGEKSGLFESFHKNGELKFKGNYYDGMKQGSFEKYNSFGELKKRINFYDDKPEVLDE